VPSLKAGFLRGFLITVTKNPKLIFRVRKLLERDAFSGKKEGEARFGCFRMNCQTQMTMRRASGPTWQNLAKTTRDGGNSGSKKCSHKSKRNENRYETKNNRRQSIRMGFGVCATGMPMKTGLKLPATTG